MTHHTIDIEVRPEDFDESGKFKADRLFHYFQETAEDHVRSLGLGPEKLIKQDLIWVLTKMKVIYNSDMRAGDKYVCTTFHASRKRATFKRDYYINYASDGADPSKALVIGTSQWCLLNSKTRKLEKAQLISEVPDDEVEVITGNFPKIHGESPRNVMHHVVGIDDIDHNDHCNNTRYIAISERATGRNVNRNIYVNFASETRLGDEFDIATEDREDGIYVEGRKSDGTLVYQLIFE